MNKPEKKLLFFFIIIIFSQPFILLAQKKNNKVKQGYDYIENRRYTKAIQYFTKLIDENRDFIEAYTGRAMAYTEKMMLDEAEKDVFKSLGIDNTYHKAHYVRGLIEINKKDYEKAMDHFETAIEYKQDYKEAKAAVINVLYRKEKYRKAQSYAEDQIKNDASYGGYYFYLGKIQYARGRYEKALELFDKALTFEANIDPFKIYLNRGDTKQNLNLLIEAKGDFDKAINIYDQNPSVFHGRGVVYYRLEEYEKAIKDFRQSIRLINREPERWKKNSETYYNIGMTYYRLEEKNKACKNFHFSCELGNSNACKMVVMRCTSNR